MKISVEYIMWLEKERKKINKIQLNEIQFTEKGLSLNIPEKNITEFEFIGLNNIDFITSGYYKEKL